LPSFGFKTVYHFIQICRPKNTIASGTGETASAIVEMVASGEKSPLIRETPSAAAISLTRLGRELGVR